MVNTEEKIRLGIRTSYKSSILQDQADTGHVVLSNSGNIVNDYRVHRYMPSFEFPVTIGILLDLIEYRLWFFKDGHCMGMSPFDDKYYHIMPIVIVLRSNLTVELERCLKSRQRVSGLIKEPAWKAESSFISDSTNSPRWTWKLWKGYKTLSGTRYLRSSNHTLGLDVIGHLIGNKPLDKLIHRWDIDGKNIDSDYDIIVGVSLKKKERPCARSRDYNDMFGWSVWGLGNDHKVYQPNGQWNSVYYGISKGLVSVIFDGQLGTLTYFLDGRFLRQPFNNLLTETPLYPFISISPRNPDIKLPFPSSSTWEFGSLEKRCMGTILKSLHRRDDIKRLSLPECIMARFDTFR